ncbi:MAG: zinc ABC transporter substrate-binding protein [Muribaculaceae bacterium]|nr:zinc ABC transporter substrate-binding protein [Muribaculaceae bacterium]
MKKYLVICCIACIALLVQGCGAKSSSETSHPIITVSLQPQKYFLEKIVGDKVEVQCLLANGANPESYEPSMNNLVQLEKSVAYIKMGNVGFEQVLVEKLQQNNKGLNVYDASEGIDMILGTHDCCGHHDHDHAHHHEHGSSADPHTWTSVKNAKVIANNMYNVVVAIDSINRDFYQANYDALMTSLDSLDAYATNALASHRGVSFLVWHPSLSYFARDFDLEQITIGQIGKELSAKQLQEKIDEAREHKAQVFFFQKEFDSQQASMLSEQIGATMITINPLSYDWETEIRRIVDAIASK